VTPPKTHPRAPGRIVGITKAAVYLGVSRWTVRTWIAEGKIPVIRYPAGIGKRKFRFPKMELDDLDRFIARCKEQNRL
jgi:excisionase family DNA binding protein